MKNNKINITIDESRLRSYIRKHLINEAAMLDLDQKYLDAIQSGDMEKAGVMVKQAFLKAFPNTAVIDRDGLPLTVYHGSHNWFTAFDPNAERTHNDNTVAGTHYFSSSKNNALTYTANKEDVDLSNQPYVDVNYKNGRTERQYANIGGVYSLFLNIENPLEIDFEGANWDGIANGKAELFVKDENDEYNNSVGNSYGGRFFDSPSDAEKYAKQNHIEDYWIQEDPYIGFSTDELTQQAMNEGYDGLIIANIRDSANVHEFDNPATDFVVFSPNQIKSAAVVIYDDNGKIIPLSQRFTNSNDMRYEEE